MLLYVIMSFREKEVGSLQNGKGIGIGERDVLGKEEQDVLGMGWEMFLGERDVHCPENGKGDVLEVGR